jgi:hypothetical protein
MPDGGRGLWRGFRKGRASGLHGFCSGKQRARQESGTKGLEKGSADHGGGNFSVSASQHFSFYHPGWDKYGGRLKLADDFFQDFSKQRSPETAAFIQIE